MDVKSFKHDSIGQILDYDGKPVKPGRFIDSDGKYVDESKGPRIRATQAEAAYLMSLPLEERQAIALRIMQQRSREHLAKARAKARSKSEKAALKKKRADRKAERSRRKRK